MIIDPSDKYARFELERIKWFLGNVDLTVKDDFGLHIQDAYNAVTKALDSLPKKSKWPLNKDGLPHDPRTGKLV